MKNQQKRLKKGTKPLNPNRPGGSELDNNAMKDYQKKSEKDRTSSSRTTIDRPESDGSSAMKNYQNKSKKDRTKSSLTTIDGSESDKSDEFHTENRTYQIKEPNVDFVKSSQRVLETTRITYRRKCYYGPEDAQKTCIWSLGNSFSWIEKSSGISWIGVNGTEYACTVSSKAQDVLRWRPYGRKQLSMTQLHAIALADIGVWADISTKSTQFRREIAAQSSEEVSFAIVYVAPDFVVDDKYVVISRKCQEQAKRAIKFLEMKLKNRSYLSPTETIEIAVCALKYLLGSKFKLEEIEAFGSGKFHVPMGLGDAALRDAVKASSVMDLTTSTIKSVQARQIFDSRGNPTVEVDIHLSNGTLATAAAPSGASTGIYEALGLKAGGSDYLGEGVSKAVSNVNTIIGPALIGKDPTDQTGIDNFMVQQLDGTQNEWGWCKQKLGANAILAVSLALCKAGAVVLNIPLYKHIANLAGNKISVEQLKDLYKSLVSEYPIVSIEDPFDQDDWEHYAKMTGEIGSQVQIVVTNPKRVEKAIRENTCNALLLEVNQIGSVTESIEAVKMSKHAGWGVMASH